MVPPDYWRTNDRGGELPFHGEFGLECSEEPRHCTQRPRVERACPGSGSKGPSAPPASTGTAAPVSIATRGRYGPDRLRWRAILGQRVAETESRPDRPARSKGQRTADQSRATRVSAQRPGWGADPGGGAESGSVTHRANHSSQASRASRTRASLCSTSAQALARSAPRRLTIARSSGSSTFLSSEREPGGPGLWARIGARGELPSAADTLSIRKGCLARVARHGQGVPNGPASLDGWPKSSRTPQLGAETSGPGRLAGAPDATAGAC